MKTISLCGRWVGFAWAMGEQWVGAHLFAMCELMLYAEELLHTLIIRFVYIFTAFSCCLLGIVQVAKKHRMYWMESNVVCEQVLLIIFISYVVLIRHAIVMTIINSTFTNSYHNQLP